MERWKGLMEVTIGGKQGGCGRTEVLYEAWSRVSSGHASLWGEI